LPWRSEGRGGMEQKAAGGAKGRFRQRFGSARGRRERLWAPIFPRRPNIFDS
jgi:hypothetical protein